MYDSFLGHWGKQKVGRLPLKTCKRKHERERKKYIWKKIFSKTVFSQNFAWVVLYYKNVSTAWYCWMGRKIHAFAFRQANFFPTEQKQNVSTDILWYRVSPLNEPKFCWNLIQRALGRVFHWLCDLRYQNEILHWKRCSNSRNKLSKQVIFFICNNLLTILYDSPSTRCDVVFFV